MMQIAAYGRLGQEPRNISTKSGKPMCVCSLAVELSGRDGQSATQWFGIASFGGVADNLARHAKGDAIGISGRVQQNKYTKNDGTEVTELQIVADNIVSARTVRPSNQKRATTDEPTGPSPPADLASTARTDFDDEIPF